MIKLIKRLDNWCNENPKKATIIALVISIIGETLIFVFGLYCGWLLWRF